MLYLDMMVSMRKRKKYRNERAKRNSGLDPKGATPHIFQNLNAVIIYFNRITLIYLFIYLFSGPDSPHRHAQRANHASPLTLLRRPLLPVTSSNLGRAIVHAVPRFGCHFRALFIFHSADLSLLRQVYPKLRVLGTTKAVCRM
jgi:hypothetical protein